MCTIYYMILCLQRNSGKHTHTYVTKYLGGCAHERGWQSKRGERQLGKGERESE